MIVIRRRTRAVAHSKRAKGPFFTRAMSLILKDNSGRPSREIPRWRNNSLTMEESKFVSGQPDSASTMRVSNARSRTFAHRVSVDAEIKLRFAHDDHVVTGIESALIDLLSLPRNSRNTSFASARRR